MVSASSSVRRARSAPRQVRSSSVSVSGTSVRKVASVRYSDASFRCVAREVASADPLAAAPARQGHGQHILYVDDEEALVFLAQRSLQRLGYRVTVSTDPLQALEIFRAGPAQFDCVVTDLSMPGMSGPDLARELLKIRPDLPIVLTSGHVRPQDVQTAQRIGIRDVMRKPGTIDELARVLDDILRERTMPRSTPDAQ